VIRVYTAEHCDPCHQVEQMIKDGKVGEAVEIIDIETEEGFGLFNSEVLSKGDAAVPSAYKDGQICKIHIMDGMLEFDCSKEGEREEDGQ
jgi:predicted thioredoxin/glutaredoxin